jgi:hypothetical protein
MMLIEIGANMTRPPSMLSRMAPQTAMDLEKAHFLGPRGNSPSILTTASTAELYTSVSLPFGLDRKMLTASCRKQLENICYPKTP